MSIQWDIADVKSRGFRTGSVLRVYMHNFIIYDDAQVFPGPKLNIVLGPNGTGKSALTHAICLACAGKATSVGRSDDLKQFVKRNAEKNTLSFCEVDLLRHDTIVTIRRTLSDETQGSKWTIDGKSSTQKQVKQIMTDLNIDVDNLCSFMPQDKVGSFTQQSAKGILQKTLECITVSGEKNLHEEQMELAHEQTFTRDRGREMETQQSTVDTLQQQLSGMKSEVERIQQRNVVEHKLQLFEIKQLIMELQERGKEVNEKQGLVDAGVKDLAAKKAEIQPLEAKVRGLRREQAVFEKTIKACTLNKLRADEKLERCVSAMNECDLKVEKCRLDVDSIAISRVSLENKLRTSCAEIAKLERQLQDTHDRLPKIQEELAEMDKQHTELKMRMNDSSDAIDSLQLSQQQPRLNIERAQKELNSLKDFRQVFLSRLHPRDRDLVAAKEWIDSNRQRLTGECYGPVGMEIQVKDDFAAHILEKAVGYSRLLNIVCENKADEDLLNLELRNKRKLSVNIVTMYHKDEFRCPYNGSVLAECRAWGLQGPISELYVMPDLVRGFLNNFTAFHTLLWALAPSSSITPAVLNGLCSPQTKGFRVFAVDMEPGSSQRGGEQAQRIKEIVEFSGSVSRYRPNSAPSIKQENVKPAKLVRGGMANDTDSQKAELQRVIAENREVLSGIDAEINQIRGQRSKWTDDSNALVVRSRELRSALKAPDMTKRNLVREQNARAELESRLSVGIEQEKKAALRRLTEATAELFRSVRATQSAGDQSTKSSLAKLHACSSSRSFGADLSAAEEQLEDAEKALVAFQRHISQCERERDECRRKNAQAEEALEAMQEEVGGEEALNKLYKEAVPLTQDMDMATVGRKIAEIKGHLDAIVDNPQLLKRYEDLKERLQSAEASLAKFKEKFESAESTLNHRLSQWRNAVKAIANKLSERFEAYMKELQYRGNVEFEETGSLSEYQMQMYVSFRGNRDMQKLSGQSHSGGERAVSTVMYLMALQELTSSPFRVVDEINQGMDERNERLVFDRIVRSCCTCPCNPQRGRDGQLLVGGERNSSSGADGNGRSASSFPRAQYFLVSPKLLEGLAAMDNDDVTVLMVYNGPGVVNKWQLGDVIAGLKKRKAALISDGSEDRFSSSTL